MGKLTRREFIKLAAACGATLAWRSAGTSGSRILWRERRDLFPQGVASGDPDANSVILWTRRPPAKEGAGTKKLTVEIAEDSTFRRVFAITDTRISAETDWTSRVLVAGLKPRTVYWYRFTDENNFGSRIGRTVTAPSGSDKRPVNFAFVSCQNVQQGACNAYQRMIWEDEKKPTHEQLGFVLHLGDFVYEIVWYPEDRPQGMYARRLRDTVRYASVGDRHSFQAGLLSASLAPKEFSPVAVEFVTGSVSAPGLFEATEYAMPKEHPLRAIYLYQKTSASPVQPAINLSLIHGVRSALALQQGGDLKQAVEASNPELSPHLSFIDMGGHGYATVRASSEQVEVEFVCIRRPLERSERADGGELSYRVKHRVKKWTERHALKLERTQVEGTLPLLI